MTIFDDRDAADDAGVYRIHQPDRIPKSPGCVVEVALQPENSSHDPDRKHHDLISVFGSCLANDLQSTLQT